MLISEYGDLVNVKPMTKQKPDPPPLIKRDFSRKLYTMTPEDILNNRVGPNVSTHIRIIQLLV